MNGLLRACSANARVNEYLVERLDPAVWRAKPPAKMRTIAAIVAHMHNCGLTYLRQATPKVRVPPDLDRFRVTQQAAIRALTAKRKARADRRAGQAARLPHHARNDEWDVALERTPQ